MKVVVELSKEEMESYKNAMRIGIGSSAMRKIINGTPLPKGHGRIGDLDELQKVLDEYVLDREDCPMHIASEIYYNIDTFEPIIEADKEGAKG